MSIRLLLLSVLSAVPVSGVLAQDFELIDLTASEGPDHPGVHFTFFPQGDTTAEAAGVTVGDLDGDGDDDLLFCGTAGHPNELYLNDGSGQFSEVAALLGLDEPSRRRGSALFLDDDNDGDLDVLTLGYPGKPGWYDGDLYSLFQNPGVPGQPFVEASADAGFVLGPTSETTTLGVAGGAAAADVDADGYLDVLVVYWHSNTLPQHAVQDQFRLWNNRPHPDPGNSSTPRQFVDTTLEAGLDGLGGWNWMPTLVDFDRDGFADLHLNVEKGPDLLLLNQGDGTFGADIASSVGMNFNDPALIANGEWGNEMGTGLADMDDDGDLDVYVTNAGASLGPYREDGFYRNDSDLSVGGAGVRFEHIGPDSGVTSNTFGAGWGAVFADLDNDGDQDLLQTRGLIKPNRNACFRNLSPATTPGGNVAWEDLRFELVQFSGQDGSIDISRGLVAADLDDDGDLDVVTTRSRGDPYLPDAQARAGVFRNTLVESGVLAHQWLAVSLRELGGSLNTVGARLAVRSGGVGGKVQWRELVVGSSFLAQESARLHVGLGTAVEADWVAVRWFDGGVSVLRAEGNDLSGRLTVARVEPGPGDLGDLDGDGDRDCDDLALFTLARVDPAAMDAEAPNWPWRLTADADGNGLLDGRDFARLRALVPEVFCRIGGALEGLDGEPFLRGQGSLQPSTVVDLVVGDAAPSSSCWVIYGFGVLHGSGFFGGVLVPEFLDVLGPLPTSAAGGLVLSSLWPSDVPPGVQLTLQAWIADAAAPAGYAASNGLSLLTP